MRRLFRLVLVLSVAVSPLLALADSKAVDAAKEAVRRSVRNKLGAAQRVQFVSANEKFLSLGEVVVSGDGHVSEGNGWRISRSFSYSVKVKRDGSQTRDIHLTFGDGEDLVDGPGWENSNNPESTVTLLRPTWYQRLNSNRVTFDILAKGPVVVSVFDQNNKKVAEGDGKPSGGKLSITLNVPNGLFRAVVQPKMTFDWDEVRFSVRSNSNDWGLPGTKPTPGTENVLQVDQPGNNSVVEGPRVPISGTCKERDVKIEAFDSRNNRVANQSVAVRGGRWSTSVNLEDGQYTLLIQSASGKDKDRRSIRVVSRGNPVGVEDIVQISSPRDGARVSKTATISGRCSEAWVQVQIFDPTNKLVQNRRVTARDGQWSVQVTLNGGSHRLVVESASGRDTDALRFTVDPRLKGG